MTSNNTTTKPIDYEETCKKIHEIHRELSGTTIPELVAAYVKEHPKPTEEEVKESYSFDIIPWEDCDEVRDERGTIHWVPKPYAREPEYIEKLEKRQIKKELDVLIDWWKDEVKMTIIQDCEGILYPDKFSEIYNTRPGRCKYMASPKIRDNPKALICTRDTWREIKNKKILAAINILNNNHKNFMIAVESLVGRPVTIGLDKNGGECYKQLIRSEVYTRPDKAPEPSNAFKWVEFLINQEVRKL